MPDRLGEIVARNLRRLRGARGWSQEELADRSGLHRTYVGAIQRQERNITLATLERLAVALGTDPVELLTDKRRKRGRRL